jgi:hypothetical protein
MSIVFHYTTYQFYHGKRELGIRLIRIAPGLIFFYFLCDRNIGLSNVEWKQIIDEILKRTNFKCLFIDSMP